MHISICFDLLDYKKVKFSFTWKCENTTNENAKLNTLRTAFNKDSFYIMIFLLLYNTIEIFINMKSRIKYLQMLLHWPYNL